jgi:hypothetical protein
MKPGKCASIIMTVCCALASCNKQETKVVSGPAGPSELIIPEGYPVEVIQGLRTRQDAINSSTPTINRLGVQSVIAVSKIWNPGSTVTVAFNGGTPDLRRRIVDTIKPWTGVANLAMDFGSGPPSGNFRDWSNTDRSFAAEIRISFDQGGYWSLIGRDGSDDSLIKPNQPSMNFGGFTKQLPRDWQAIVLHEFGHAIGFGHEHQNAVGPCEAEFRWDNEPGYVETRDIYGQFVHDNKNRWPGIYTLLEGPPNKWSKDQIDFNLRQLPNTSDWRFSDFDKLSIMKYYFDSAFFKNGKGSGCYGEENLTLSAQDRKAAAETYPRNPSDAKSVLDAQLKAYQEILSLKQLPPSVKSQYRMRVNELPKH